MSLTEQVKALIDEKSEGECPVVALDGMPGCGKSTVAEQLCEMVDGQAMVISTDTFILVSRHRWEEVLTEGDIQLDTWYDLGKIREVVQRVRHGDKFSVPNLYNLANGQHDRVWEIDATGCRLVVLEGLFALHEELSDLPDVRIFLEIDPEVALERARQRDLVVRNIEPEQFERKISIYFDRYAPHVEDLRSQADIVHETG